MAIMLQERILMHSQQTLHNGRTVMVMVGVTILVETMQMHSLTNIHNSRIPMEMDMETIRMESTLITVRTAQ